MKDGGPVFPILGEAARQYGRDRYGMTLRDYLAAKFAAAWVPRSGRSAMPEPTDPTMQAALDAGRDAFHAIYDGTDHDAALKAAIVAAVEAERKRYAGLVRAAERVIQILPPQPRGVLWKLHRELERLKEAKP